MNVKADLDDIYGILFQKALQAELDGGGLIACNYLSGEPILALHQAYHYL